MKRSEFDAELRMIDNERQEWRRRWENLDRSNTEWNSFIIKFVEAARDRSRRLSALDRLCKKDIG